MTDEQAHGAETDLPEARIVVSPEQRSRRNLGPSLLGAVFTIWSELLACVLLSALIAELDGQQFEVFDIAMAIAFGVLAFLLAHRIVRPSELEISLKNNPTAYPSTSWVHALFDALYAAFGTLFLVDARYKPGPEVDAALCLGLGFTILPGALFVMRLMFWRRQREIDGR